MERDKPKKIGIDRTNFAAVAMEIKKEWFKFFWGFLSSNFMKHRRNIHRSCVEAFGMLIKFKMVLPWKPRYEDNWGGVMSAIALQWQF